MKPRRGFEISELSLFRGKCENEVNYLNDKILYWNQVLEKYINPIEWKIKIKLFFLSSFLSVDVPNLFYPENTLNGASKIGFCAFNPNLVLPGLGLARFRTGGSLGGLMHFFLNLTVKRN